MKARLQFFLSFLISVVSSSATPEKQTRLIGAQRAQLGQFPWVVSLQRDKTNKGAWKHFCAGSILDTSHIITAAHCVWNKKNVTIVAAAGSLNVSSHDVQQRVNISKIYIHPKYKSENRAGPYDVAVLELQTPLIFGAKISPISLPSKNDYNYDECRYAGWGNRFLLTGLYYSPSEELRTISSRIIPKMLCHASYLLFFRNQRQLETALCTAAGPLRGSCQGDSGGPLTCYKSDGTPYLAGIVSWGWFICGDGIHPDVSSDVSLFLDFINRVSKKKTK